MESYAKQGNQELLSLHTFFTWRTMVLALLSLRVSKKRACPSMTKLCCSGTSHSLQAGSRHHITAFPMASSHSRKSKMKFHCPRLHSSEKNMTLKRREVNTTASLQAQAPARRDHQICLHRARQKAAKKKCAADLKSTHAPPGLSTRITSSCSTCSVLPVAVESTPIP